MSFAMKLLMLCLLSLIYFSISKPCSFKLVAITAVTLLKMHVFIMAEDYFIELYSNSKTYTSVTFILVCSITVSLGLDSDFIR